MHKHQNTLHSGCQAWPRLATCRRAQQGRSCALLLALQCSTLLPKILLPQVICRELVTSFKVTFPLGFASWQCVSSGCVFEWACRSYINSGFYLYVHTMPKASIFLSWQHFRFQAMHDKCIIQVEDHTLIGSGSASLLRSTKWRSPSPSCAASPLAQWWR